MKTFKNRVLSVLLLTFVFVSFHDFAVTDTFSKSEELVSHHIHEMDFESAFHLHDFMHTMLFDSLIPKAELSFVSSYAQSYSYSLIFISHTESVPQRPPIL